MKKTYITPTGAVLRMESESPIMAASLRIEKGEGTAAGSETLSNRKQGIWDSESWMQTDM